MKNERENYSWGIIQDMIEREISLAFKLREPPNEQKNTKEEMNVQPAQQERNTKRV
jgi:hypothetical protein